MPIHFDHICVYDTGGTLAGSIAKTLRALGVASVLLSAAHPEADFQAKGAILAGNGIVLKAAPGALENILSAPYPILALGANAETVLTFLGGKTGNPVIQKRASRVKFLSCGLFDSLMEGERYFDLLPEVSLDEHTRAIARAEGRVCAYENRDKNRFGAFFSIEKNDPDGLKMLENFARSLCGCSFSWNTEACLRFAAGRMADLFPSGRITVACSGGLLSGVSAMIAFYALGERAQAVMADTGLIPESELKTANEALCEASGRFIPIIDIKDEIHGALKGVTSMLKKRDVVFKTLFRALKEPDNQVLFASGTDDFSPVDGLFRDEVRALGKLLGLSEAFLNRRPFPGAGLAVRMSGEITEEKTMCLMKADAIFEEEIRLSALDKKLWQYYASLVEAETGPFIVLHALISSDCVNGYACRLPYDVIERTVMRIMEESSYPEGILYDVSGRFAPHFSL